MDCFLYDNGLRHERVKKNSVENKHLDIFTLCRICQLYCCLEFKDELTITKYNHVFNNSCSSFTHSSDENSNFATVFTFRNFH